MGLDDKDGPEELEEGEATSAEIADACRGVVDEDVCDEIAAEPDAELALMNAMSALIGLVGMGEDEAEAFLREKGILGEDSEEDGE